MRSLDPDTFARTVSLDPPLPLQPNFDDLRKTDIAEQRKQARLLAIQAEVPLRSSARNSTGRSRLACDSASWTPAATKSGP